MSRMRFIQRWGLMYSTYPENISEHSLRVAMIAQALALIRNEFFGGNVNADRIAGLALYHDASEVLTGDLPAPVKYFNPDIQRAYKAIEASAAEKLIAMLPEALQPAYRRYFEADAESTAVLKAADKLRAYLKCLEEVRAGNLEFTAAEKALHAEVTQLERPEVDYFMQAFVPSFQLTLDELG